MLHRARTAAVAVAAAALAAQALVAQPAAANPVVGYIKITMNVGDLEPKVVIAGVLNSPIHWTCTKPVTYVATVPYTVSCTKNSTDTWRCDILHANSATYSAAASLRTSMYCDGSTTPTAQTNLVTGVGGYHYKYGVAGSTVTQFRCTVDNGGTASAVPNYYAFCGDPPSLGLL